MATTNVRIPERRGTTYKQGDRLIFHIDGTSVPMLDAGNTFLRFNVNVGGKGVEAGYVVGNEADVGHMFPYMFNEKIGCESLIKELTIKTVDDVILEQLTSYNILCRAVANTEQNETMHNLKRLYGGADKHNITEENTLTRRVQDDDSQTQENREIEVLVNFSCSGLLSGENKEPVPVSALGGLIVEILLENDVWKCVQFQGERVSDTNGEDFLTDKDDQSQVLGYSLDTPYCVESIPAGDSAPNVDSVILFAQTPAPISNVKTADLTTPFEATYTPIFNGQTVVIGTTPPKEVVVSRVVNNGGQIQVFFPATDFAGNTVSQPSIYVKYDATAYGRPDINLSNVELICGVAQPDEKQVNNLIKAVGSSNGYLYNYASFGHFSNNLGANALRTSSYIPARYTRATALLSTYENIEQASSPLKDNLCGPVDTSTKPKSVQYVINNLLVPTREVKLEKYNNTRQQSGGWQAIHIKQLNDAMHCAGKSVRDLTDLDGCLVLGQCLAPRPHVFNMNTAQGETRINLNFDTTQSRALLLHNFVHHYKTLVIKDTSKMVVE